MAKLKAIDPAVERLSERLLGAWRGRAEDGSPPPPATLRELATDLGEEVDDALIAAAKAKPFSDRGKVVKGTKPDSPLEWKSTAAERLAVVAAQVATALTRAVRSRQAPTPLAELLDDPEIVRLCEGLKAADRKKVLTDPALTGAHLTTARSGKSKPPLPDALILPREALNDELMIGRLLRMRIEALTTTAATAFDAPTIVKGFDPELARSSETRLARLTRRERLVDGVGCVLVPAKNQPKSYYFAVAAVLPAPEAHRPSPAVEPPSSEPPPQAGRVISGTNGQPPDFAAAFRSAFDRLDRQAGRRNLIKLVDLRRELDGVDRPAFDAGLRRLREAGEYQLDRHDGRYRTLTDEEREAAIVENGSTFVYVARVD